LNQAYAAIRIHGVRYAGLQICLLTYLEFLINLN